jgi:hypothetical protein
MTYATFAYPMRSDMRRLWFVANDPMLVPRYLNFVTQVEPLDSPIGDTVQRLRVSIVYKIIFRGSPTITYAPEPEHNRVTIAHAGEGLIDFTLAGVVGPNPDGSALGSQLTLTCDYKVHNQAFGWIAKRLLPHALRLVVGALDRFASQQ